MRETQESDLIILAGPRLGLWRSSPAARVLLDLRAPRLLLVGALKTFVPVLVLYDGSPSSEIALNLALALAGTEGNHPVIALIPLARREVAANVRAEVARHEGLELARIYLLDEVNIENLARVGHLERDGLLVLGGLAGELIEEAVVRIRLPILLVPPHPPLESHDLATGES